MIFFCCWNNREFVDYSNNKMSSSFTNAYTISDGNKYLTTCGPSSDPIQILTPESITIAESTSCYLWEMTEISTSSLAACTFFYSCSPYGTCTLCSKDTANTDCLYQTSNCDGECTKEYYCSGSTCRECVESQKTCEQGTTTYPSISCNYRCSGSAPMSPSPPAPIEISIPYSVQPGIYACPSAPRDASFTQLTCTCISLDTSNISATQNGQAVPVQNILSITNNNNASRTNNGVTCNVSVASITITDASLLQSYSIQLVPSVTNYPCGTPCGSTNSKCTSTGHYADYYQEQFISVQNSTQMPLPMIMNGWGLSQEYGGKPCK